METILDVQNLSVEYFTEKGKIQVLKDISFAVNERETLGIVGESGCGKSTLALAILRLIMPYEGKISAGRVLWKNKDILKLDAEELRKIRGKDISIIFQDPFCSLNPVIKIGKQIVEILSVHNKKNTKNYYKEKVIHLLHQVKLPNPLQIYSSYPHQLSGGMLQRVNIAMALSLNPNLLLADEPTTALDVTVQKEIIELLKELQIKYNLAVIFISHNLALINELTDYILVLYAGRVVEIGKGVVSSAFHPYTKGLLEIAKGEKTEGRLKSIKGNVCDFTQLPKGCKFYSRCDFKKEICKETEPHLIQIDKSHWVRCNLYKEGSV